MIWHNGEIVPDGQLSVPIDDRGFEHGLGLFETFRSWNYRAPLLARHLERLRGSARALGIRLESVVLPDQAAVSSLLRASELGGDAMLRLTVSGGSESGRPPVAWLAAKPLPAAEPMPLAVGFDAFPLSGFEQPVHAHKMLNYWGRRTAYERARSRGLAEVLIRGPDGRILEGSRNTLLMVPGGEPGKIIASSQSALVLPGIMARFALDFATRRGYLERPCAIVADDLLNAGAVFLTNSVRGVRLVGRIEGRPVGSSNHASLVRLLIEELPRHLSQLDPDEVEP